MRSNTACDSRSFAGSERMTSDETLKPAGSASQPWTSMFSSAALPQTPQLEVV